MSPQKDKRARFDTIIRLDTSGLRYGEGAPRPERLRYGAALRREAERQALLLEVASDLIRSTSELGELGRMTFERIKSAFDAVVCTNYRLDPTRQRLRLVFAHGIPPEG